MGWQRVGHDWATNTTRKSSDIELTQLFIIWESLFLFHFWRIILLNVLFLAFIFFPLNTFEYIIPLLAFWLVRYAEKYPDILISVQFSSVAQSGPTLCDPIDCSTPGLPVHHQLPEFTQTHAHWVGDAIHPSHPRLSPSPPAFNLSQHQALLQWASSSHQVAKVLEFQLQHQSFQWTLRAGLLYDGLVGSPCSPRDSQESCPTPLFKSINSSMLSFLYGPTLTSIHDQWKNHSFLI